MKEEDILEINRLFTTFIETIDLVLNNKFYTNVKSLLQVKNIVQNWHEDFKKINSLTTITVKDLEFLDVEITEFFDKYIVSEPVSHNYSEILSYYLSNLERYWKDEMKKGGKENAG